MIVCTFKALKHERVSLKTTLRSYFTLRRAELILNWSWNSLSLPGWFNLQWADEPDRLLTDRLFRCSVFLLWVTVTLLFLLWSVRTVSTGWNQLISSQSGPKSSTESLTWTGLGGVELQQNTNSYLSKSTLVMVGLRVPARQLTDVRGDKKN